MKSLAVGLLTFTAACTSGGKDVAPPAETSGGIIRGVVVNEKGRPVGGAKVSARWAGSAPQGKGVGFDDTDSLGQFQIGRQTWGPYNVCAQKESDGYASICGDFYGDGRFFPATLSPKAPLAVVRVVVGPKAGVLSGSVTSGITGTPLRATMSVRRRNSSNPDVLSTSIPPRYRMLIPPDTDIDIVVDSQGYRTWRYSANGGGTLRLKSDQRRTVNIRLWPDRKE